MTWAKLPAIQANCGIEMTLDACMLRLSEVMAMKKQVTGLYRMARVHSQQPHAQHLQHSHSQQQPQQQRASPGPKMLRQRIPSWINLSDIGERRSLALAEKRSMRKIQSCTRVPCVTYSHRSPAHDLAGADRTPRQFWSWALRP